VLGGKLRRVAPALRRVGIDVELDREGNTGRRLIKIKRRRAEDSRKSSSPSSPASPAMMRLTVTIVTMVTLF
jgi:hypothetical protein